MEPMTREETKELFGGMLEEMKAALKTELKQEFASQVPEPPPPVQHFSAEQFHGLEQKVDGMNSTINKIYSALDNMSDGHARRSEANGDNHHSGGQYI